MRIFLYALCLFLPVALTACEKQDTYPLSGEDCGPKDPVQTLDASDCTVPVQM